MTKSVFLGTLTVAGLAAGLASAATLDDVKARGELNCGVSTGLTGFSLPDANGNWTGFDVSLCRAVAAAVLGDGTKVKFVPTTGQTRFTALASGEVDMLARNSTWTFSRDTDLKLDFVGVNYYDGQGLHGAQGPRRDLGQGTRRRHRLHPDRHHDRAEPRRLVQGQQPELHARRGRDQRRGRAAICRRRLRCLYDGCLGPRRHPRGLRRPGKPHHPFPRSSRKSRSGRPCATATTNGPTSSAGR